MSQINRDLEDLGRSIQNIVDRAVNSQDYQKLNQTIRQTVDKAVDLGTETVRKVVDGSSRPAPQSVRTPRVSQPPVKKNLPVLYGNTNKKTAIGIVKTVGGGLASLVTFILFLMGMILLSAGKAVWPAVFTAFGLGGSLLLTRSGVKALGMVSRFKTYRRLLGEKTHCTVEKLARNVGKSVKFVRKDLFKMIEEGFFLEGHMDYEGTALITSDETYRYYEQSRLQLEQRKRLELEAAKVKKPATAHTPQVQEVLDRGNAFLEEIRRCNDAIPGREISEKISRMELIVQRIFERAEAHPEIVPDLKKLMDYYLPMTVKLLNAYADMDAQPVQGENILASKQEIEGTLDTLNLAFEKLLDDLFEDTAMDVSSDISVLNTLLAQEGLAEDEFTKMRNSNK